MVKKIKFEGGLGRVRIKKKFPETITLKISGTNSSFHVEYYTTEKFNFPFSRIFF